jgi:hypothetical protein
MYNTSVEDVLYCFLRSNFDLNLWYFCDTDKESNIKSDYRSNLLQIYNVINNLTQNYVKFIRPWSCFLKKAETAQMKYELLNTNIRVVWF